MKTIFLNHLENCDLTDVKPCAMALGFFDGIHLGHRKLIEQAKKISKQKGLELAVLTFFPHPKEVLNNVKFHYLITIEKKIEILEQLGVEHLFIARFDEEFANLKPEEFVQNYLIRLKAKEIVAGFDFTYGRKGEGNIHTLEPQGRGHFRVSMVEKIEQSGEKVSSTLIRKLLSSGNVEKITEYLGAYYHSNGVITGIQRKSFCTKIKMRVSAFNSMPNDGVYEVDVLLNGRIYAGICTVFQGNDGETISEIETPFLINHFEDNEVTIKWLKKRTLRPTKKIQILTS